MLVALNTIGNAPIKLEFKNFFMIWDSTVLFGSLDNP